MRCIIVEDNSLSIRKGEELMIKMNNGKVINCHAIDTDLGSPWEMLADLETILYIKLDMK